MPLLADSELYIDGKLRGAESGAIFDVINPWNAEVIGHAANAGTGDMDEAISAARKAFDESDWPKNTAARRAAVKQLCDLLIKNRDRLAELAVKECGAALGGVSYAHVDAPLSFFDKLMAIFDSIEWEKDLGIAETW